jgi:hypothetical protein
VIRRTPSGANSAFNVIDDPPELLVALKLPAGTNELFAFRLENVGNAILGDTPTVAGNDSSGLEGAAAGSSWAATIPPNRSHAARPIRIFRQTACNIWANLQGLDILFSFPSLAQMGHTKEFFERSAIVSKTAEEGYWQK